MTTNGKGPLIWSFAVHSLHNALIEDGFGKLENHFSEDQKSSSWNFWVKFLRKQIA